MRLKASVEEKECLGSCLDDIVTVSDLCNGERECSLSGFDLMDAPEISITNLSAIANETYMTGLRLARAKVKQAALQVKNDMIAILNTNNITTDLSAPSFRTSTFNPNVSIAPAALERGITIFRSARIRGKLKKVFIKDIEIYPLVSAETHLLIYDNGYQTSYPVSLVGGKVNSFQLNYIVRGKYARFVIDDTNVTMASATLMCTSGCNGTEPNYCAYTESYNGSKEVGSKEGYGINLIFSCECDYDQFLCDLAKTYVGELIWLKSRILLLDERLHTSRMNNWVVYNREESAQMRIDLDTEYREKWNGLVRGMYSILKNYRDSCLECRGIRWVVNG